MSVSRINLQNTPTPASVATEKVMFTSSGVRLRGVIFRPIRVNAPLPGVVVTGAWTSIKEQMAGTYARELAARGFVALAFDPAGWGESDGNPRYVEDPEAKTVNIVAAAEYLAQRNDIDQRRIFGVGICASAGYMAAAVADSNTLARLALVAPWLHDPAMAEGIYGGAQAVAALVNASEAVLTAASTTDAKAVMYQAPYYTEADRGLIAEYDNKFSSLSWRPWLTYDAFTSAQRLSKPLLMVGSKSMALPVGTEAYQARTRAPVTKLWLGDDVTQFDFYDREDVVCVASDEVARHFNQRTRSSGPDVAAKRQESAHDRTQ